MCMNRCRCSNSSLYRLFDPRLQSVGAISYVSYEYSPAVLKTSWDLTLCTCVYIYVILISIDTIHDCIMFA